MSKSVSDLNISSETFKATIGRFVMLAGGFVGTILFARVLGRQDFGGVYTLLAIVTFLERPMVGWAYAVKKRFTEGKPNHGSLLGLQFLFNIAWIGVCAVAVLVASRWLSQYTGLPRAAMFVGILLLTQSVYATVEQTVQAQGRIGVASWIDTLRSYLTLGLQVALLLLGLGTAGVVYGLAMASALSVLIGLYFIEVRPAVPGMEVSRNVWQYAKNSIPGTTFSTVYDRLDVLLLAFFIGPGAAGDYEAAWKLTIPAMAVADFAGSGLMVKVSSQLTREESVSEDISNTLLFTSVLALPIFFGALGLSRELVVTVFGGEYVTATPLLIGLAGFRVLQTQRKPLSQVLGGLNRPDLQMRLAGLTLAINVVAGAALILLVGPVGVVLSTIFAESIHYLGSYLYVRKFQPEVSFVSKTFGMQALSAVLMYVCLELAQVTVAVNSWVELTVLVTFGAVVYFTVLLTASRQFRRLVESLLPANDFPLRFRN